MVDFENNQRVNGKQTNRYELCLFYEIILFVFLCKIHCTNTFTHLNKTILQGKPFCYFFKAILKIFAHI